MSTTIARLTLDEPLPFDVTAVHTEGSPFWHLHRTGCPVAATVLARPGSHEFVTVSEAEPLRFTVEELVEEWLESEGLEVRAERWDETARHHYTQYWVQAPCVTGPAVPPMPQGYRPDTRLYVTTDAQRRFFWLRENGYRGPIDMDGHAVPSCAGGSAS